jgi:cytochrome c peroxidase
MNNKKVPAAMLVLLAAFAFLQACQKSSVVEVPPFEGMQIPPHFPIPVYDNPENEITQDGFELGRRLFYDPILSRDSSISCGTCHTQVHGFADHNVALSTGIDGRLGTRNTPGLNNLAWQPVFMLDGGVNHLEIMPFSPITEPTEMDETLANVVAKLNASPVYRQHFQVAFGIDSINSKYMFYAIAQFQSMLVSANSKYDKYMRGEEIFTDQEERGLHLFRMHCESCHEEPLTTDYSYANMGLDLHSADAGRARITGNPADSGKFKVPALRNVGLTYPYMHDGRFYTLDMVLDHYSSGIVQNGRLDPRLPGPLQLSGQEKADIIAFLSTLTDYEFMSDMRFSEPRNP